MHDAKAAPSSEQVNVAPASDVKLKEALPLFDVVAGDAVIDALGAAVSIVHVKLAGVESVFPAASLARTWKVCVPSASAE